MNSDLQAIESHENTGLMPSMAEVVRDSQNLGITDKSFSWQRFVARPRMDLSNLDEIQLWAKDMKARGETWLVIDLKGTRFMSLPVIGFIENLSADLKSAGGALALVSMPDKTRRIFEIYGSLKNIFLVEKIENLKSIQATMLNPLFQLLKSGTN